MPDGIKINKVKHNLTKRQLNILRLIYIAGDRKNKAIIPQLKDFELIGISRTKITQELQKLEKCKVIKWDRHFNLFEINDQDEWDLPIHKNFDGELLDKIIKMNKDFFGEK